MKHETHDEGEQGAGEGLGTQGTLPEEEAYSLDPFAEASVRQRESILKPILMLAVLFFMGSLIGDYREEIDYYFQDENPIELGEVDSYPSKRREDPSFVPPIKHNSYVHLRGIPLQRSQSQNRVYFQLAGDDIFVEERKAEPKDELEALTEKKTAAEVIGQMDRTYYEGYGRALSFARLPGRYNGIRRYYSSNYGETFCETLDAGALEAKIAQRRDAIVADWHAEYSKMTPEERARSVMKAEPSAEELDAIVHATPICIRAYLIQDDRAPKDHLGYVIGLIVAIAVMLYNAYQLVRWIIRAVRP